MDHGQFEVDSGQGVLVQPVTALDLCGGVARWTRLAQLGVGRGALVAAARAGLVARPGRGVFCRPELVATPVVRAVVASGQLTCAAAAHAHGLDAIGGTEACHVRTPPNPRAARSQPGTVLHPWGLAGGEQVAGLIAVLHDCAACLPIREAVVVIDSALRQGRVQQADLTQVVDAGPHRRRVRQVVDLADPQAQSVLESLARTSLVLAGVRGVQSQVWIKDVGWVDLLVEGWLVVELDGWQFHRLAFQEDRRRDAELTRRGLVVLRFTHADLTHREAWFVEVVQEALVRGRPPFGDLRLRVG